MIASVVGGGVEGLRRRWSGRVRGTGGTIFFLSKERRPSLLFGVVGLVEEGFGEGSVGEVREGFDVNESKYHHLEAAEKRRNSYRDFGGAPILMIDNDLSKYGQGSAR